MTTTSRPRDAALGTRGADEPLLGLRPTLIGLLALACGISVANVYFAQPLLPDIARGLSLPETQAGLVVTVAQVGYVVGLVALVPLGDLVTRRRLIPAQCLGAGVALVIAAIVDSAGLFFVAVGVAGAFSAVVQVIVAFASALSPPGQRGRNVGLVTSGVVMGILLGRMLSGALADALGWRAVYAVLGALSVGMAAALVLALPNDVARAAISYRRALLSTVTLTRSSRLFRARALMALLVFAAFSTLWNSVALPLSEAPWHLSAGHIGLLGLAGVSGALGAARAGALADRGHATLVTASAFAALVASWGLIAFAPSSLVLLVVGIVVLDLAVQAVHVTSQSQIVGEDPGASSRIIGSYMVFYSIGSALGALGGPVVYAAGGWLAVSALGAAFGVLGLMVLARTRDVAP